MQVECLNSAFTPGSVDSAGETSFYHLDFHLNVRPGRNVVIQWWRVNTGRMQSVVLSSENVTLQIKLTDGLQEVLGRCLIRRIDMLILVEKWQKLTERSAP